MKMRRNYVLLAAVVIVLAIIIIASQLLLRPTTSEFTAGCEKWCRENGYKAALSNECQPIGSCVKGLLLPSESSSVCPETLEGCCCLKEE